MFEYLWYMLGYDTTDTKEITTNVIIKDIKKVGITTQAKEINYASVIEELKKVLKQKFIDQN